MVSQFKLFMIQLAVIYMKKQVRILYVKLRSSTSVVRIII